MSYYSNTVTPFTLEIWICPTAVTLETRICPTAVPGPVKIQSIVVSKFQC